MGVSCNDSGGFTVKPLEKDPRYTGASNKDGFLFTHDGNNEKLQNLKNTIDSRNEDNQHLTNSLESLEFDFKDESNLDLSLKFKGSYPVLKTSLKLQSEEQHSEKKVGKEWNIQWECLENCFEVQVILSHIPTAGSLGFIVKSREEVFSLMADPFAFESSLLNELQEEVVNTSKAQFKSQIVAWGASRFEFKLGDFCFGGELVETNESGILLKSECHNTLKGDLLGNGLGAYFFRFSEKTESLYLTLGYERELVEDGELGVTIEGAKVISADLSNPYTRSILKDRNHPVIVENKKDWKKKNRYSRFMDQMKVDFPKLKKIFEADGIVPNEMIFITLVESNYFVSNPVHKVESGRKLRLSNTSKKYCKKHISDIFSLTHDRAVGPWQFRRCTGEEYGLKTKNDGNGYIAGDERADLLKSTQAAVKYLSNLLTRFHSDPKLALAGYNFGGYGTERKQACLVSGKCSSSDKSKKNAFDRFNDVTDKTQVTFWMLDEFNMLPKETSAYVKKIVSAQILSIEGYKNK